MHPDELLERLSYSQFLDWQRYYDAEPWGELRSDLRQAVLLRYVVRPFQQQHTGDQMPAISWPYFGDSDSHEPVALLAFLRAFDSGVRHKEGGGYELLASIDELMSEG